MFCGRIMEMPGILELMVLSSSSFSLVLGEEWAAHSKELARKAF